MHAYSKVVAFILIGFETLNEQALNDLSITHAHTVPVDFNQTHHVVYVEVDMESVIYITGTRLLSLRLATI